MQETSRKNIQIFFLLLICVLALLLLLLITSDNQIGSDFTAYWASARLLINGQNSYSSDQIFALEKSVGWTKETPLVMYNPPWVMTFILPFAFQNFLLSKFLWFSFLFVCIFICTDWLWQFYGGKDKGRHLPLLIILSYPPIYFSLLKCQISPILLLGIVGFLNFEKQKKWFLTGSFLCLLGIKPQVLYLFFIALIFWIIYKQRWQILLGAGCVALFITTIPLFYNPDIFNQYYKEIIVHSYQYYWDTPTWGNVFRALLGRENKIIQYIPTILGITWFFYYWHKNWQQWNWTAQTPIIIFTSLITTFYVWHNDYILILVPIIQVLVWVNRAIISYAKYLIFAYATIIILAWVTILSVDSEKWIIWFVPALLINYLLLKILYFKIQPETEQPSNV